MRRRPAARKISAESVALQRQIAAAAAPVLTPLGCRQKGKSPLWIADHGLWVVLVDLQPGIVTVGASFLWWVQSRWSFDQGVRFTDLDAAEAMVQRAGEEVVTLRSRFSSMAAIAASLSARAGD
ncbi:MAG TPA: hypothetical protein VL993_15245, partial [Stellaceae bacterium]|nr:hypothetical protein [Stellaceae bacterium]